MSTLGSRSDPDSDRILDEGGEKRSGRVNEITDHPSVTTDQFVIMLGAPVIIYPASLQKAAAAV